MPPEGNLRVSNFLACLSARKKNDLSKLFPLCQKNNLSHNFRTVSDRNIISGMHTLLMIPFQIIPASMTLLP